MKLHIIGSNQTEIEREDGVRIFFSYKTPVAVWVPGKGALVTKQKYSVTTSRHINATTARWSGSVTKVEQEVLNAYVDTP